MLSIIRWGVWVHPSFHVYTLQGDCGVCSTPLHMELIPPPRFQIEVTPLVHVEAAPQLMVHHVTGYYMYELVAKFQLCYVMSRYVMLCHAIYYFINHVPHDSHVYTISYDSQFSIFLYSYHVSYDP